MSNYNKLYTPAGSAIAFIDHQPQMTFGVANIDRATLINHPGPARSNLFHHSLQTSDGRQERSAA
jgi:hypothetical protein